MLASAVIAACSATGSHALPDFAGDAPSAARAAAPKTFAFAPYVDMTAYPPFLFAQGAKSTGTRYYTMAFLVSLQNKTCRGAWGAVALPNDPTYGSYFRKQLAAIRKRGGDAILSFGGAGNSELAQVCPDARVARESLRSRHRLLQDHARRLRYRRCGRRRHGIGRPPFASPCVTRNPLCKARQTDFDFVHPARSSRSACRTTSSRL